jgi:cytochrome c oxidase subunit 1
LWPPVVASAVLLLSTNAHIGTELIASAGGSNLVSNPHTFLLLVHPELYILILLSFGIVGEIVCTSSKKSAFVYRATVYAMTTIGLVGFFMWAHRVYTGASAADSYSVLVALVVAAPTSIMIVAWLVAMLQGRVSFRTPMLWATGFIFLITAGGAISVIQAGAGAESAPRDAYSLPADFLDVLLLGAIFVIFAGWYYWFPKITGLLYNEALGKLHFWITFIGVNLVFVTQHFANPAGMLRRYVDFRESEASWHQSTIAGGYITLAGVAIFLICMAEALVRRQPASQNPWKATTREWTSSNRPLFHCFVRFR